MKKRILMFVLISLVLISFNGLASGYEIVGGYYYNTLDTDLINKYVDEYNEYIEGTIGLSEFAGYEFTTREITPLEKAKNASGYYIGISADLQNLIHSLEDDNLFITGQYETFSTKKKGSAHTEWIYEGDEGYTDAEVNVGLEVKGLYGEVSRRVNDYINISAGVGYYVGRVENYGYHDDDGDKYELDFSTDLKGKFGFKLGASLNHQINDSFSLLCSVNFKHLKMDLKEDIELDSYEAPFNVYIPSVDLSGFESKLGLSYSF